jgi:osmotically-inducible protein OsmY
MKRILITVLAVMLGTAAVLAQNKNTKPAKAKAPAADCSAVTDARITEDVKAKLQTPSLKELTINVNTSAGAVTLTGSAKTATQRGTATRQARRVPCVKSVDNQMTVEPSTTTESTNSNSRKKRGANKNM